MPYRDRTGPNGAGPGSGRGMGPCVGNISTQYGRRGGMGFGRGGGSGNRGFGAGRSGGRGFGFQATPAQGDEKDYISGEINALEQNLDLLKKRLKEIESDKKNK